MHDGASGPQFAADALWRQAPLAQPLAGCTERQSGRAGGAQPTQMPGWGCQSARASQIARARPRKLAAPRDTIHKVRLYRSFHVLQGGINIQCTISETADRVGGSLELRPGNLVNHGCEYDQ